MELSGRPLLATRVDEPFYVCRGPEERILAAARRDLNVLILGDAGAGKTTLLHFLERQLQQADEPALYIDGRHSETVDALLDEVRRGVGVTAGPGPGLEVARAAGGGQPVGPPAAERTLERLIDAMPPEQRWVVLVDSPARDVAHTLFGRLRDVVWQLPISWVVAADTAAETAFRRAPAEAFFDLVERVTELNDAQARELLVRRGIEARAAEDLTSSGTTTPRNLLDRARRSVLESASPDQVRQREVDFQQHLGAASRAAAMLATELRGQGAVSASDQELQRRMGWTRPRLTQVLKELEAAGLARATQAADGRAGRPRRLYEIIEP